MVNQISVPFRELKAGDVVFANVGNNTYKNSRAIVGHRPVVIITNQKAHDLTRLVTVVPVTRTHRLPKASVEITSVDGIEGYAEPWQVTTLDLQRRGYSYVGRVSKDELTAILARLYALTDPNDE